MTTIYPNPHRTSDARILAALVSATFLLDALIVFGIAFLPGVSGMDGGATVATATILTAVLFAVQFVVVVMLARLARASIA
ncbi:hypothetical protein [Plantibacter flavus]|nr:hypothetical protein [Plantibacter flavus]